MDRDQVVALMENSQSEQEWNSNCDKVKKAHGGIYPEYWFSAIVASGLAGRVLAGFGRDDKIHIAPIPAG